LGSGNGSANTADFFKVRTCALPPAIYRHKLSLTSGILGQTIGTEAMNQLGPGCGSPGQPGPGVFNLTFAVNNEFFWDAFGKSEQQYFNVRGTGLTTAPYTLTLSTATITPTLIGPFAGGSITITTVGQGHTTDTSLLVYDSTLTLIPTYQN